MKIYHDLHESMGLGRAGIDLTTPLCFDSLRPHSTIIQS